ncbi:MAG TPA: diphthine--ammonia ligase [Spirochaetia bacterium]|nr:diphthine--ammonia ligase [Spirochaetia bacterium]
MGSSTERVLVSWSGGKDSTLALNEIVKNGTYRVAALVTTVTADYDRISMHGVRRALLEQQAASLGLPLEKVFIPSNASNAVYEQNFESVLAKYAGQGVQKVVFGDLFLEDLRKYREERLASVGMSGVFPIWMRGTKELAKSLISLGFKAITTCVDTNVLDKDFVGRLVDEKFLADLPASVDPCGENGEYHSFVHDGPIFSEAVRFTIGEKVLRDERFYFCDLVPAQEVR